MRSALACIRGNPRRALRHIHHSFVRHARGRPHRQSRQHGFLRRRHGPVVLWTSTAAGSPPRYAGCPSTSTVPSTPPVAWTCLRSICTSPPFAQPAIPSTDHSVTALHPFSHAVRQWRRKPALPRRPIPHARKQWLRKPSPLLHICVGTEVNQRRRSGSSEGQRILVVDDHPEIVDLVKTY